LAAAGTGIGLVSTAVVLEAGVFDGGAPRTRWMVWSSWSPGAKGAMVRT
jgi:hypothetical protein